MKICLVIFQLICVVQCQMVGLGYRPNSLREHRAKIRQEAIERAQVGLPPLPVYGNGIFGTLTEAPAPPTHIEPSAAISITDFTSGENVEKDFTNKTNVGLIPVELLNATEPSNINASTAPTLSTTTTLNPEETGAAMCILYNDCTARLEAEKVDCINTMIEAEISQREHFNYALKEQLNKDPPLGATVELAENCYQYAIRHYPLAPNTFPLDYKMGVEVRRRRDQCLRRTLGSRESCADVVSVQTLDNVRKALDAVDAGGYNRTFEQCRTNVNLLIDSCMALRQCCPYATPCDTQSGRKSIAAHIEPLPLVPEELIRREAKDCLELRAKEALPPPPSTLSPLRVWLRKHKSLVEGQESDP